jgi:Leucine-rich repeat (LRR) protein
MSLVICGKEYNFDTTKISMMGKYIKEIPTCIKYLIHLTELYFGTNSIDKIPSEIKFLTQLIKLGLSGNYIKKIPSEIQFLTQLIYLNLSENYIKKIPSEIQFLTQLIELDLSDNQINKIPNQIKYLIQLTRLHLNGNYIKKIPKEIKYLIQLTALYLDQNYIREIPIEIKYLIQIDHLYLNNNDIIKIPIEIINLKKLYCFYYDNNPIENLLNPVINRFINQINKQIYNIHNDTQNVHSSSIQHSIKDSIFNLLKQLKRPYKYNYLDDPILTQQTKQQLIEYSNCTDIHTQLECTFEEILNAIFYEINSFDPEKQISAKKRINEEMLDGLCVCFTGRISRLVNSLSGLSEKVSIKISDNEEISNIIILANKKYKKIEEIKDYVKKEMKERLYNESIIEEWLSYID